MERPLILVTAGREVLGAAAGTVQAIVAGCDERYVKAVLLAGGAPILLPPTMEPEAVRAAASVAQGVLFTGGADILSLNYGAEPDPACGQADATRDSMELTLAKVAAELGLPVLGVCRGMQLLNVAAGGTIVQDIPSHIPEACRHNVETVEAVPVHTVEVEPGSHLARVLGATTLAVNSHHHQAVADAGRGLKVTARARDGVAEGMEAVDGRRLIAVQWHPEEMVSTDAPSLALFTWLIEEARRYQTKSQTAPVAEAVTTGDATAVSRVATAIISEALRQSATEIHLESHKQGVKVSYAIENTLRESMNLPKHIRLELYDRIRTMAGMDITDRNSEQTGTMSTEHDGKTYHITVRFEPSPLGESIFMKIEG